MTTISYKDGIIAYDTRMTAGTRIIDDDSEKRSDRDGVSFFASGDCDDIPKLIDAWFGGVVEGNINSTALVFTGGELYLASWNSEDGYWRITLDQSKPYSIGSGSAHAWTAMDMGATALQSVEMAMKRDTSTGGSVRTFTITSAAMLAMGEESHQ